MPVKKEKPDWETMCRTAVERNKQLMADLIKMAEREIYSPVKMMEVYPADYAALLKQIETLKKENEALPGLQIFSRVLLGILVVIVLVGLVLWQ